MWRLAKEFEEIHDALEGIIQVNGHTVNFAKSYLVRAKEFCHKKVKRNGHTQNEYMSMQTLIRKFDELVTDYERNS